MKSSAITQPGEQQQKSQTRQIMNRHFNFAFYMQTRTNPKQLLSQLKIRQMSFHINLWKAESISSSKTWLLHLIPEISPKYFTSNLPTADEFAIRKHKTVTSATCQLENTPPEKEPTSLSRG